MKANLILVGHGNMAIEALKSAEMIVGNTKNISVIGMTHDDGMDGIKDKLSKALDNYKDEAVLIIADLYGGTPFNVSVIMSSARTNTKVITGFNLGMIVEYCCSDEEDMGKLANYLVECGRNAISFANITDDDDDDIEA